MVGRDIQRDFRMDTGRLVDAVADCFDIVDSGRATERTTNTNLEPSLEATLRMINYYMEDVFVDRDTEISLIPSARTHSWLKGWRGLEG